MKYIFVAGAPGSKWSSVVKNIYYSASIDRSDYSDARTYYHDASGELQLMHLGAYFDPGMESNLPEDLSSLSKEELEKIFDSEFSGKGVRIIKSHIFSTQINFIRATWPDCPIVLINRSDDACLGWWVKCGHFDITYPLYHSYYKDLKIMAAIIKKQNEGLVGAWGEYKGKCVNDNKQLAVALNIAVPHDMYQEYASADIEVKVI